MSDLRAKTQAPAWIPDWFFEELERRATLRLLRGDCRMIPLPPGMKLPPEAEGFDAPPQSIMAMLDGCPSQDKGTSL